jgi:hypothetical protein
MAYWRSVGSTNLKFEIGSRHKTDCERRYAVMTFQNPRLANCPDNGIVEAALIILDHSHVRHALRNAIRHAARNIRLRSVFCAANTRLALVASGVKHRRQHAFHLDTLVAAQRRDSRCNRPPAFDRRQFRRRRPVFKTKNRTREVLLRFS